MNDSKHGPEWSPEAIMARGRAAMGETTQADLHAEAVRLREVGTELLQAAILKLNKPAPGTMVQNTATGKFQSVDGQLIAAVKKFAGLVGLSLGEETEAEALDRKTRGHQKTIEVIPD